MFDFAWTQIGLIGVVALVLIGPKDMPVALKAVSGFVKKARKMAGEFQGHVDEMVRDTELADIRTHISDIRNFDIRREVERAVDSDGGLRSAFAHDPIMTAASAAPPFTPPSLVEGGTTADSPLSITPAPVAAGPAPAFVPPAFVPPAFGPTATPPAAAPAFIPPAAQAETRSGI